jgi:hypothetical protein
MKAAVTEMILSNLTTLFRLPNLRNVEWDEKLIVNSEKIKLAQRAVTRPEKFAGNSPREIEGKTRDLEGPESTQILRQDNRRPGQDSKW